MRFVPLLLSFGLTVKDTTLSLVYWLWSENTSLKHTIFERFQTGRELKPGGQLVQTHHVMLEMLPKSV
jgi:hypothetical protein